MQCHKLRWQQKSITNRQTRRVAILISFNGSESCALLTTMKPNPAVPAQPLWKRASHWRQRTHYLIKDCRATCRDIAHYSLWLHALCRSNASSFSPHGLLWKLRTVSSDASTSAKSVQRSDCCTLLCYAIETLRKAHCLSWDVERTHLISTYCDNFSCVCHKDSCRFQKLS